MKMNVVELSKRKGGPSALQLVALLSLVLGACASRQKDSGPRGVEPDVCTSTDTIQLRTNADGSYFIHQSAGCVAYRGTVTLTAPKDVQACYVFPGTTGNPFGPQGNNGATLEVVVGPGQFQTLTLASNLQSPSYTFYVQVPCMSFGDSATLLRERDGSTGGQGGGLTGTLEVGYGGGTEDDELKRPAPR